MAPWARARASFDVALESKTRTDALFGERGGELIRRRDRLRYAFARRMKRVACSTGSD
jgi:hypothetical protein